MEEALIIARVTDISLEQGHKPHNTGTKTLSQYLKDISLIH